jgi:hypothetical protein
MAPVASAHRVTTALHAQTYAPRAAMEIVQRLGAANATLDTGECYVNDNAPVEQPTLAVSAAPVAPSMELAHASVILHSGTSPGASARCANPLTNRITATFPAQPTATEQYAVVEGRVTTECAAGAHPRSTRATPSLSRAGRPVSAQTLPASLHRTAATISGGPTAQSCARGRRIT